MGAPRPIPDDMLKAIHSLYELHGVPGVRAAVGYRYQHITDTQIWAYARRNGLRKMRGSKAPPKDWEDEYIRRLYPEVGAESTRNTMLSEWEKRQEIPRSIKYVATRASLLGLGRNNVASKFIADNLAWHRPAALAEFVDARRAGIDDLIGVSE